MKSWYSLPPSPPLLSIKVFDTRNFVKHRRSPLRSFSVLWDNSFSIENRDIPLLSIKFFDTRIFSPTKFFGTLRQQIFYRKSWYSPYRHKIFRYVKLSETQGFLYEMIRYWDKNFWNTEGFLYEMIRYWDKTSETQKGSSMKWFGTETKKFWTENRDAPPPPSVFFLAFFDTRNNETLKDSPTKFFDTVRQNYFDGKEWYLPPLSVLTFFDTRNVLKNRRVPLRNFSVLWDNRFSLENRDILLLGIKFCDTWNFLRHRRVPLRNDSVLKQNYFDGKSWYPPPFSTLTFFDTRNFPKQGFLYEIFRYCETKILTWNRDTPSLLPLPSCPWSFSIPEILWNTEGLRYEIFPYCETTDFL